jgi:hypothetical protein
MKTATPDRFSTMEDLADYNSVDKRGHGYLPIYSALFEPIRFEKLSIVEIGFRRGRGMRFFGEYFNRSMVYSLDVDARERRFYDLLPQDLKNRMTLWQCDQSSVESLTKTFDAIAKTKYYTPIDIIIDDGSHVPAHQICSFETLWPRVNSGGYYVIEDLHPSYVEGKHPTVEHFKNKIDPLNRFGEILISSVAKRYQGEIPPSEFEWIMFTLNRIIVRKKIK